MRRLIIVFFFSIFSLVFGPVSAADRGALFKLSAHGHTMYLFGTMHVGVPGFYPFEPRLMAALSAASTLALELDPDPSPLAAARAVARHGMLAQGPNAYMQLGTRKLALLDELARQAGMAPSAARNLKPVLLAVLLSTAEYEKLGYRADLSTDRELVRLARAGGKRILELESLESQLTMLDRLSAPNQWRFLDECLDSIVSGRQLAEARSVVDAWGSADRAGLDAMAARVAGSAGVSGQFARDVLLDGRNPGLADKLAALLGAENNALAAIGVLHLLGPRSVPALLAERGVHVERVY